MVLGVICVIVSPYFEVNAVTITIYNFTISDTLINILVQ